MKAKQILRAACLFAALMALRSQAALLGLTPPTGSPSYADFTASALQVDYTYSGGVGNFTATDPTSTYTYTTGTGANKSVASFSGYYSLNATIQQVSGAWQVTSGTMDIYGNLDGNSSSGDLLLQLDLKSAIGYNDRTTKSTATQEFDFLFTVDANNPGNSQVVQNFFGAGTGQGAIQLYTGNLNPLPQDGAGYINLANSFQNEGSGSADAYVPEPVAYPLTASVAAMMGLFFARRKNSKIPLFSALSQNSAGA